MDIFFHYKQSHDHTISCSYDYLQINCKFSFSTYPRHRRKMTKMNFENFPFLVAKKFFNPDPRPGLSGRGGL